MTDAFLFLINAVFNLYLMVVLLRVWLQLSRADFYNPFSQFIVKATHPIVGPLRRIVPSIGSLDTASLILAFGVALLKVLTISFLFMGGLPNVVQVLTISLLGLIKEAIWLLIIILIVRALMSWFSQGRNPLELVMHQLTEPVSAPIRRIIPPVGGLDLSFVVIILGLQFCTYLIPNIFPYF